MGDTASTEEETEQLCLGSPALAASQQRHICASAAVPLLLLGLCWWLWKRSSRNNVLMDEQEEERSVEQHVGRYTSDGVLHLPTSFVVVEELMHELPPIRPTRCKHGFCPVVQPVIATGCALKRWSAHEHRAVYCLLVPLPPLLGSPSSWSWAPRERCHQRAPESLWSCSAATDRGAAGGRAVLPAPPPGGAGHKSRSSLPHTLGTGSSLDTEKTARWFQGLLRSARKALPVWEDCCLTVLLLFDFTINFVFS